MAATPRPSNLLPQNLPPRSQSLQISSSLKPFFPHPPLSPLSEPLASFSYSLSPSDPQLPPQTLTSSLRPPTSLLDLSSSFISSSLRLFHPSSTLRFRTSSILSFGPSKPPLGQKQTPPPQSRLGPESLPHLQQGSPGHGRTLGILPTLPPGVITLTSLASPRLSCSLYRGAVLYTPSLPCVGESPEVRAEWVGTPDFPA